MHTVSQPRPVLLVFARWWAEGPVKSRLAAEVGADVAREAYRLLAETVWEKLAHSGMERHLWVEPASEAVRTANWLRGADRVEPQPSGDLSERLSAAFAAAFAGGAPWAAAVGTDSPDLDATHALLAGRAIVAADLAIVPALDGGYALIALRAPEPRLFGGIPWGTPGVLDATRARAAKLGLRAAVLEPVSDVDTLADLQRAAVRFPRVWPSSLPARPT